MVNPILVAESDFSAAKALAGLCNRAGYRAVSAHDAVQALTTARQTQPELILLNSRIAGGGAAALRRIRSNAYTANIPVVVMTSSAREDQEFMAAGAQACVQPPIDEEKIREAVSGNMLQSLDFTQAPAAVLEAPARMQALQASGLLDSPPSEALDALTALTARLLKIPTSLFSLVDKDRQFFKSQIGLGQPWSGARQTRLSHSFCQWVVSSGESLSITDARNHPVLNKNLAIRDLGVIAYAGVPVSSPEGQPLGSFCAIHSEPREWSEEDMDTLKDLANVVEAVALPAQALPAHQVRILADSLVSLAHILRRYEGQLVSEDRLQLLASIEAQSTRLRQLKIA